MSHNMFPKNSWVVTCPYKWLEQNNEVRRLDGNEPEYIREFTWVEREIEND